MPNPDNDLLAARRDAIHALCVAQAQHQLSVDVFEQRLALLNEAPTAAAVRQIVGDLEPSGDYPLQRLDTPLPLPLEPTAVAPLARMRLSAVFSGAKRSGHWTVPLLIEAKILFGSVRLDLRDAWFEADTLEVEVDAICGSLEMVLPPGTQVENEIDETLSGSDHKRRRTDSGELNGLLVRLTGTTFMSGLKIIERPPTSEEPGLIGGIMKRLRR